MQACQRPRVKVCCISSLEEARLAVEAGASALGLVSAMPSGPGVIEDDTIRAIASWAPPAVATFLLTSLQDPDAIVAQQRRLGASTLQLVDRMPRAAYALLRRELPGIKIVQVVHVTGPASLAEAREVGRHVDAVLLDSGNPNLAVKELGGTGRRHDWRVSRAIREALDVPLFLAGGLRPDNLREALSEVGPFGLDVCSGVRSDQRLDPHKLSAFFSALQGG